VLIEIIGLPGSGKTSFTKALMRHAVSQGDPFQTAVAISGDAARNKAEPRYVTARSERILLHHYVRFQRAHPELDARLVGLFGKAPQRHLLYAIKAASFQAAKDLSRADERVIMDEGLLSLGITAFFKADDPAGLRSFTKSVPPVDALLWVHTPPMTAFGRAAQRYGTTPDQRKSLRNKHGDKDSFKARAQFLEDAVSGCRQNGVPVIQLDAETHPPDALARQAFAELTALSARKAQAAGQG
jgi:hypothetical protein